MGARAATQPSASPRPAWVENAVGQALALLASLAIALVVGTIIILLYGENPLDVFRAILKFGFKDATSFGSVLAIATPLIFAALAVLLPFKAGMFNIGGEGQFLVAMVTASFAALYLDALPGVLHLIAVLLAAMAGGMIWASVPAILKVKTGAHEVVTTIMMNGIAVSFLAWALNNPLKFTERTTGQNVDLRTDPFPDSAIVPDIGDAFGIGRSAHLSWLFPLAVVTSILIWFLLRRMRLGYEARAIGSAPGAARAGGVSIGSVQIKLFLIAGAMAGLVGMQQLLAEKGALVQNYEALLGFTGIAVAFLAQNNPIGVIFAAILWAVLARGETALQIETEVPREFVIILQGLLIMSVVIVLSVAKRIINRRQLQAAAAEEEALTASASPETVAAPGEGA